MNRVSTWLESFYGVLLKQSPHVMGLRATIPYSSNIKDLGTEQYDPFQE